jgi:hypothetical protein
VVIGPSGFNLSQSHPRVDSDGHGIQDHVELHPPLPRRLFGSGECLLDVALLLLEQEGLNLPGLGLADDGTGQLVEPLVLAPVLVTAASRTDPEGIIRSKRGRPGDPGR